MTKLAIDGGQPLRTVPFPSWPIWDEREEELLLEVLHSGQWGIPLALAARTSVNGGKVALFEEAFGAGYAVVDLLFERGQSFYLLRKDWTP